MLFDLFIYSILIHYFTDGMHRDILILRFAISTLHMHSTRLELPDPIHIYSCKIIWTYDIFRFSRKLEIWV